MNLLGKNGTYQSGFVKSLLKPPYPGREIEILVLVCQQMTTEEIAEKLFISMKTVNGHRNNLLQKTGARNAAGLVFVCGKKWSDRNLLMALAEQITFF